ncbi:MAG: hypothetical protein AVDCRST_MAG01-01-3446 [uncultured Rubrobacteraceae bacterium]|uniref:Uncharacterized protein n=1 Tax=uncultured Rubrobacteraceae bacterium TaxID=349277 RepID=A0A6J4QAV8_9ACTN|nr:MAG: hypothetical protein AVDCRST_MAG01-01-3446 [uncultured Rubrobacteraceae bacterium]
MGPTSLVGAFVIGSVPRDLGGELHRSDTGEILGEETISEQEALVREVWSHALGDPVGGVV